ncbi:hypothetical protein OPV22_009810 [Ensete ventricosum]|uniref:Uncharacterized protein n=1 Tax=Ensete ventricosum TaxID=4639 RepID=A0AAV8RJR1_ENSVE|nr:hypothetical protein OPV22_009810 [Ensete ventricosum]
MERGLDLSGGIGSWSLSQSLLDHRWRPSLPFLRVQRNLVGGGGGETTINSSGPDGGIQVKKAQKDQGGQNGRSNELQKKSHSPSWLVHLSLRRLAQRCSCRWYSDGTGNGSTRHGRRNTISGFNCRSEEHAEKHKDLEEKNHAKNAEKTNLQAESDVTSVMRIRRLR